MLVLIDNYDSFTYNLWHYLGELGADAKVFRNDALSVDEVMALEPEGIVISPGPCDPDRAGICLDLVARCAQDRSYHRRVAEALRLSDGPVWQESPR